MTTQDVMDFFTAYSQQFTIVGTVVSAVATVLSALAAFLSARSASQAIKFAELADRRFNIRAILVNANAITVERDRIKQLADNLKLSYQSLAVFSGSSGGSREQMYQKAAYEKYDRASELAGPASILIGQPKALQSLDNNAVDEKQVELSAALLEMTALRDRMIEELSDLRLQISDMRNSRTRQ